MTVFFTARFACEVNWVSESHTAAASNGTLQVEILTGTEAPSAGLTILNTAFDLTSTANTVVQKTATDLVNTSMMTGDRLALKYSGTLASLAGVQVTCHLKPLGRGSYRVK